MLNFENFRTIIYIIFDHSKREVLLSNQQNPILARRREASRYVLSRSLEKAGIEQSGMAGGRRHGGSVIRGPLNPPR